MGEITAFISYSHDDDAHRARVLEFSQRLRRDGVVTILDQRVGDSPPEGWARWMMNALDDATHVLCVCTETYNRRFRGHEATGKGHGVDWEGALITQALYESRSHTNRFIPILFDQSDEPFIPMPLRSKSHHLVSTEAGYQALHAALLGQPGPARQPRTPPSPALAIWQEKLGFLLVEEAITVDPEMKLRLKHLIADAKEKIEALRGGA